MYSELHWTDGPKILIRWGAGLLAISLLASVFFDILFAGFSLAMGIILTESGKTILLRGEGDENYQALGREIAIRGELIRGKS